MTRIRVGVVLLLPDPAATEIQGLRRACGDSARDRVPPHITLVPPLNLRAERLGEATQVLRQAATSVRPFAVELGPVGTFLPVTPVLRLDVGAAGLDEIQRMRDAVFVEPLTRAIDHPFVPHVTLAAEMDPERIVAAVAALADYRATVTLDRVHLMLEGSDRVWTPLADAPLGPRAIRGRGGVELDLAVTAVPDPDAYPWAGPAVVAWVVTARRLGAVVGVARCRTAGGSTTLDHLEVVPSERGFGIGSRLVAAVEDEAAAQGATTIVSALAGGYEGFLKGLGWATLDAVMPMGRRLGGP